MEFAHYKFLTISITMMTKSNILVTNKANKKQSNTVLIIRQRKNLSTGKNISNIYKTQISFSHTIIFLI